MACRNLFPDSNSFQTPVKKPKTKNKMKRVFESNDSVSSLSNRDPDNIMNVIHKKRKPIKKQGLSINFFDP
jgi:hypothetical protein